MLSYAQRKIFFTIIFRFELRHTERESQLLQIQRTVLIGRLGDARTSIKFQRQSLVKNHFVCESKRQEDWSESVA